MCVMEFTFIKVAGSRPASYLKFELLNRYFLIIFNTDVTQLYFGEHLPVTASVVSMYITKQNQDQFLDHNFFCNF